MDNIRLHHAAINRLEELEGIEVIFLPPYSQEYNPKKQVFKNIKDSLKRKRPLCRNNNEIIRRVNEVLEEENFKERDLSGYFRDARRAIVKRQREGFPC